MPTPLHLGSYSIVEQIGVGASSNVYLAISDKTFASVAIKQLRPERLSAPYRSLLANEVAVAAHFRHKNVVHQIGADLGEVSGPYLVLEYLKGESLDYHQNTDNLLPINKVLAVIEQAADALHYVAQLGFVHRDVKPENIIMQPNGLVKLMDFGCAIKTGETSNMVAGSLAYMSPEQLDGLPLDERADIYSLGATLYRLLTGKNTFTADNAFDARIAVLNFPATPIQNYRQELPANLTAVVHKALQKEVSLRYANWAEFIAAFGNAAHEVRMSVQDFDVYRGFTRHTQSAIYHQLSASRQFSRSGFSRSAKPGE